MDHAVITGDIVESSQLNSNQKDQLNEALKKAFEEISNFPDIVRESLPQFNIFRGDSFQGLLANPKYALKSSIFIRAMLRKSQPDEVKNDWDARIAVGIGKIDYLPDNITEGDGEAYQNSGPVLDNLKGNYRSAVKTSSEALNQEFKAESALLDAVIARWTKYQAEIVVMLLKGMAPKTISEKLDISKTAVHYRIKGAAWFAVEALLERYTQVVETNIN